jgi:hypothetical protein
MTLYQFNALNEKEQFDTLWDKGVHISERENDDHRLVLYQIDNFYVEVWYHMEENVIKKLKTFSSTGEPLKPYLEKIDISNI